MPAPADTSLRSRPARLMDTIPFFLFLTVIFAAGLGPLLRVGELTLARAVGVCFVLYLLPRTLARCTRESIVKLLPPLFGLIYAGCQILAGEGTTATDMLVSLLFFGYGMAATSISLLPITARQARVILIVLIFVGGIAALSAIFEDITGYSWYTGDDIMVLYGVRRSVGLHGNPNATAEFILLGFVPAVFLFLEDMRSKTKLCLMAGFIAIEVWGLYTTASRGAVIAGFLALTPLLFTKRISLPMRVVVLLALVLGGVSYQFLAKGRELSFTADGAGIERAEAMQANWERFLSNPVIGNPPTAYDPFDIGAHNNFLQVLVDGGIVSAVPYLFIYWVCLLRCWKKRTDKVYVGLLCVFLAMTGVGLSHTSHNNIIFWCIIGLCLNDSISYAKHPQTVRGRHRVDLLGALPPGQ